MSRRRQSGRSKARKRSSTSLARWIAGLVTVGLAAVLVWQFNQDKPFERLPPLHRTALQLKQVWRDHVVSHTRQPSTNAPTATPPPRPASPPPAVSPPPIPEPVSQPFVPAIVAADPSYPTSPPPPGPRDPQTRTTLEAQIALMRRAISPGVVDGVIGSQTRAALRAYQQRERLPVTDTLDAATRARLWTDEPLFVDYFVTSADVARLEPLSSTWLGKSQQRTLEFETVLELVSERSKSHTSLVRSLNPTVDWTRIRPGTRLRLPNTSRPPVHRPAAFVLIRLSERTLQAYDRGTNLLAHFPCSIGRVASKRPTGELEVQVRIPNPNYTFNPAIFPESAEGRGLGRKLVLPPGPNNPVGTAWIGLDKPAYGIHGTPIPENVGRTESHGCFRLANWDAEYLLELVWTGMPVRVEE